MPTNRWAMSRTLRGISTLAIPLAALAASPALASTVFESELNGQSVNNLVAGAQFIGASSFTANGNPNIFGSTPTATVLGKGGGNDVDFFAFHASAGAAYFDIDGAEFDTYLALFDANGTLLADNDDSFPGDAGNGSQFDAFLGSYSILNEGTYLLAVARSGNFANATFTGNDFNELFRPDGAFGGFAFGNATFGDASFLNAGSQLGGGYTLHISAVPGPSALGVLASVVLLRRRGRRI
jgi:hypothetical protein